MSMLLSLVASASSSPVVISNGSGRELEPMSVGPGAIAFIAVFAIVVASIFLFRSMTGHLRKVDYRSRERQAARRDEAADDERAAESSLEDPGDDDEEQRGAR